jgi:hypothetical protein
MMKSHSRHPALGAKALESSAASMELLVHLADCDDDCADDLDDGPSPSRFLLDLGRSAGRDAAVTAGCDRDPDDRLRFAFRRLSIDRAVAFALHAGTCVACLAELDGEDGLIRRAELLADAVRRTLPEDADGDEQETPARRFPVGSSVYQARMTREDDGWKAELASLRGMEPIGFVAISTDSGRLTWIPREALKELREEPGHWRVPAPDAGNGSVVDGGFIEADGRHSTNIERVIRSVLSDDSRSAPTNLYDFYDTIAKLAPGMHWQLALTSDPSAHT